MLRALAIIFGIFFILFGFIGFMPAYMINGKLFDIFRLNFEHNIAHFATGIISFLCGLISSFASKNFFIICGVIYLFFALLGFRYEDTKLFNMIAVNMADNALNAGIGIIFLLIGFGLKAE